MSPWLPCARGAVCRSVPEGLPPPQRIHTPSYPFGARSGRGELSLPPAPPSPTAFKLRAGQIQRLSLKGSWRAAPEGLPPDRGQGGGREPFPSLRTETFFQKVPVFRMAYSAPTAHCAVSSETLMLQVRCANPPMPHRTSSSSCSGVSHGLFMISHHRPCGRWCSARLIRQAETLDLQPLRGLHRSTLCCLL